MDGYQSKDAVPIVSFLSAFTVPVLWLTYAKSRVSEAVVLFHEELKYKKH